MWDFTAPSQPAFGHPDSLPALLHRGVDQRHRFSLIERVVHAEDGRTPCAMDQGIYDLELVVDGGSARPAAIGLKTGDPAAACGRMRDLGQQIVWLRARVEDKMCIPDSVMVIATRRIPRESQGAVWNPCALIANGKRP